MVKKLAKAQEPTRAAGKRRETHAQVAEAGTGASLPARKPFGTESDEDEEDDAIEDAPMDDSTAGGPADDDDDELMITEDTGAQSAAPQPPAPAAQDEGIHFAPVSAAQLASLQGDAVGKPQMRKIPIPPHRMSPLKRDWAKIYTPLVEHAGLMVRMNVRTRCVELKVRGLQALSDANRHRRPSIPRSLACCRRPPTLSRPLHLDSRLTMRSHCCVSTTCTLSRSR